MNAAAQQTLLDDLPCGDPGEPRIDVSIIGQLAFGRADRAEMASGEARHLALLPKESLELDLSDPVQRQFGDYELLELIGEGGMGVVYRARQSSLDREVAVKLLAAGPWASKEFIQRFLREAQNAARMQHPNIVAIYEVGDNDELHFFSMRMIRGPSLAAELKREGRLSALRAAQLLRVVAEAVDYAHRLDVLHLDLKPANVLIDEDGTPHVADFGLARRLEQGLAANTTEISGTPSYMAPEQATARQVTPATDIWGLGAVLYELVTGEPPFCASTPRATLKLVVDGTLRNPRRFVPDLPLDIVAIIRKCLARDADGRYRTARELADDLTRFIEGREVRARPLNAAQRAWRWARREPKLALAAALAIAALVVGMAATTYQWQRSEEHRLDADEQKHLAENNAALSSQRLWASRHDAALRLEKDGKGFEALPQLIANIEEQERAGRDTDLERHEVGMVMNLGVTLIDRLIIPDANPMTAALSPDGSLLAVALNDVSVRWYDTATLTERGRVDFSDLPTSDESPHVPQLLEFIDNHRLRVTLEWYSYLPSPSGPDMLLIDLDRAQALSLPPAFADFSHATYTRDGRHALLFNDRKETQLWQVDPWVAKSPPIAQLVDHTVPYLMVQNGAAVLRPRNSLNALDRFDPRHPSAWAALSLPPHGALTAWTESNDGSLLALGDADGQVFLVDLATLKSRQLPIPSGRHVSWFAFSEDDAWLAVAREDGSAFAFDVATGAPSGQLHHEFALRHVALSRRERLLIASGNGDMALWRLPDPGPGGSPATLLISGPTHAARAGPFWAGMSLQAGLLATADFDGEVRLWRLPASSLRQEHSARAFDDRSDFDGDHLVDVESNRVRVASMHANVATPWADLPDPPAFAELTDGSATLVAVSRHTLYVFDTATMRQRYVPVPLRADPMQLAVDSKGTNLTLAFGENAATGFTARIEAYDLKTGTRRAGNASVRGPLRRFRLSPDGARLVVVGPADGSTEVFDSISLRRIGAYAHDAEQPVLWADFAPDSTLWLVTRSVDDTQGDNAQLIRWNTISGLQLERREVPGIWPVGVVTLGDKPLLAGKDRLVLDPGSPASRNSARLFHGEGSAVFAISNDHRLIAHAFGRDVQIYEAETMLPIGEPLRTDIGMLDGISQLAFAPDDSALLCRTLSHHWFVWNVAADRRPLADLRADAALLTPDQPGPRILRTPAAAEKAHLRGNDMGAWRPQALLPAPSRARTIAGVVLPARPEGLSSLMLDLTSFYTSAPDSIYNVQDSVVPNVRDMPFGVARIENVDYDLRGGVELRWGDGGRVGTRSTVKLNSAALGIRVPPVPIAAFHVLIYAAFPVPGDVEDAYANVRLHYRDGGEVVLPMRANRELPGGNDRGSHAPIGWVAGEDLRLSGELRQRLVSNPRLPNPQPQRLIASLDVETSRKNFSTPVIFAITAEPAMGAATTVEPNQ